MKVILVLATMMIGQLSHAVCNFPGAPLRISRSAGTGLSEAQFNNVIDRFVKVYTPIVSQNGGHLILNRKWSNDVVNSDTTLEGSNWVINAYGGLARFPGISQDGYLMVLCHEVYHHLGGFPRYGRTWASSEGQCDYGAAMKCFPRFATGADFFLAPSEVTHKCQLQHSSTADIRKCEQTAVAAMNTAQVLNKLNGGTANLSFSTPDSHRVMTTNVNHPAAQCRLDTYFAGAVCGKGTETKFSPDEPKAGSCSEEAGEQIGVRSRCWYAPSH